MYVCLDKGQIRDCIDALKADANELESSPIFREQNERRIKRYRETAEYLEAELDDHPLDDEVEDRLIQE